MAQADRLRLHVLTESVAGSVERAAVGAPLDVAEEGPLLQVGELAKATGKTVRAIHLYEGLGLLKPAARTEGRYRLFTQQALVRVRWISKLQSLGLSLAEIQDIARAHDDSQGAMFAASRLRETYAAKLEATRAHLAQLHALEAELETSLRFLQSCDSTCVPTVRVESCPTCVRHAASEPAPDLVAGWRVS